MLKGMQEWVGVGGPALFGCFFSTVGFIKDVAGNPFIVTDLQFGFRLPP